MYQHYEMRTFITKKPMLNKQTSTITKDGRTVSFLSSELWQNPENPGDTVCVDTCELKDRL